MQAARIHAYGGPEVLSVDTDVPAPEPSKGQVQVAVHASSINPVDLKIASGTLRAGLRYRLPRTLGMDLSGVVSRVGPGVTRWKVGDAVIASPNPHTPGTWAEYTCVREDELGRKPINLDHTEAAGLPLAFLTAWQALVDTADVQPGQAVFIQAGAGGVGSLAIQIARHLGATVTTTCGAHNRELVTSLGADRVIDYRVERWQDVVRDQDVTLDALGPAEAKAARQVTKRGGWIVGIATGLPARVNRWGPLLGLALTGLSIPTAMLGSRLRAGVRTRFITRRAIGAQLDTLAELCEQGTISPVIDAIHPLEAIHEAVAVSLSGRARGKLVLQIR